jgi:hypothetical protein
LAIKKPRGENYKAVQYLEEGINLGIKRSVTSLIFLIYRNSWELGNKN